MVVGSAAIGLYSHDAMKATGGEQQLSGFFDF
jgi:hypothetical protein